MKIIKQYFSRRSSLSVCIALAMAGITSPVYAELYFAPELISSDIRSVADLSRFQREGAQLPGVYQTDIYVNGKQALNRPLRFIDTSEPQASSNEKKDVHSYFHDNTGLMPCLTRHDLESLGIKTRAFPDMMAAGDEQCLAPGKYIPEAYTAFNFQTMRLDISVPQAAMQSSAHGYIPPERWDEGINAALLNYSFSGNQNHGRYGDSGSHYLNLNAGLNLGAWRLRDYRTWSEYDSHYYKYRRWQRIKTYAERDIIALKSEIILGDSTTGSDVFDSLGVRGIQLQTDDSMFPDSVRGFAPVIRGTATSNAKVTIRQNGYTVYQTFVSPGEFAIDDLYPVYSSGDLEVSVTEVGGHTRVFSVPYSSVPVLQREGRFKYALSAGRYQSFSSRYDSPEFVQGTLIWGLPHNVTAYGGIQYAEKYRSVLAGAGLNLGMIGAFSADITQADSTLADGSHHQGQSVRFLYARTLNSLGTTFQLTGYRYSTQGFHSLDETALKGMEGWRYDTDTVDAKGNPVKRPWTDYYNLYNTRRAKTQASISQRLGQLGSLYLTGVRQTYWNTTGRDDSLQAGFSSTAGNISYSLSYGYSKSSSQSGADKTFSLSVSVPLDTFMAGDSGVHHSLRATYMAARDSEGRVSHQAGLSGTALQQDNLSWNVTQGYSHNEGESGNLSADYQGGYGNVNAGYSYNRAYRQTSYGVNGSAVAHSEGVTLGQPLGETSVLIAAPGVSGVSVENETGIHTDWRGYAVKPYASVYRENRIALDASTLDDQTDVENTVVKVVPTRGAVVRVRFKGRTGSRVLLTLTHNGTPLPFGTVVTAGEQSGIVGDEGVVYLSGINGEGAVKAVWGDGKISQCTGHYRLPSDAEKHPYIRIKSDCL
ncbi:fimbrial biogenesis usher protein [Klebsiella oxytoca]|uniref:fimbrial biogenesis usher protein n=1 Tax=Klebsiella oxytoca TaxID=571 RepID=UPI003982AE4B